MAGVLTRPVPTPAQVIILRVCNGELRVFEKMNRKTGDADTQACLAAGWLTPGIWRYATTGAGAAAAGITHSMKAFAERTGFLPAPLFTSELPLAGTQLNLFEPVGEEVIGAWVGIKWEEVVGGAEKRGGDGPGR
ncbi:hypothetical protein [Actinoplanes sp. NBRC 101535]|uniref:hypothetical protein n=1 Tax=Actinoplanes sp. NBRC 101535 TaxID=3032196 RepID=UPI0024A4672C|nr:hypothetical protein [Actinoplanes sp. NBRC 101535]GLY08311.1 hypothetical protein Acsp01_86900 [Actinoplanes sp. NBRC 101535]